MQQSDFYQVFSFLPVFMKFLFLIFLVLLFYNRKSIFNAFKKINRKTWLILLLIVFVAFLLRFFWIPHYQIIGGDGRSLVELGMTISEYGVYGRCGFASDNCYNFSFFPYPPAYPVLLSVAFNFFEASERTAFNVNALLGTISVFFAFLFAYLYTKKENLALLGAFVFGLIPPLLKFSGGAVIEIFSVFFLLLIFVFFKIFLENKSKGLFLLFLSSLLIVTYIRPENIFLAPFFLLIIAFEENTKAFLDKEKVLFTLSLFIFFLFLIPALWLIHFGSNIVSFEGWAPTINETFGYFFSHIYQNFYFFLNPLVNSLVFFFLAVVGMITSFLKERREFFIFLSLFLVYFFLYSGFDVGVFRGAHQKFSLILYVPLLFFFITGIICFFNISERRRVGWLFVSIFLLLFIGSLVSTYPYIANPPKLRDSVSKIEEKSLVSAKKIPRDAYIVSHDTYLTRPVINRKAVNLFTLVKENHYFNNKKVFFFKDSFFCTMRFREEDVKTGADFIYTNYELQPVETTSINNKDCIGIYKLIKKSE